jgi:GNAT superfamily N-acetyltransferase
MEMIIRALNNRDLRAVCDLSTKIWDGKDYLASVAKDWILDGGFYGLELDGKIVGTAKMTLMPNRVVWLEGLRVLPEFQKQGYGKKLADFILKLALKLVKKGKADLIEFSTYYKNTETIALATAAGFQEVDKFYLLSHKPVETKEINLRFKIHPDTYKGYPTALPFGWKFLHPNMKSLRWLNKKTKE